VGALERQGLVQRDGRASIRPGPVLLRFAGRSDVAELIELAAPALDRLAELSGETTNLGVAMPAGVDQLDQRDSRHFIGSTNWLGRCVPYHCTAQGKVFLAFRAVSLPVGPLERLAPATIVDPALLEAELDEVRARGYATTMDELEPGLWAVATPVRREGATVAALSISGPTTRLRPGLLGELAGELVEEARQLSALLETTDAKRGAA
jgi:DNA-binding IclR family transcriptional regulator